MSMILLLNVTGVKVTGVYEMSTRVKKTFCGTTRLLGSSKRFFFNRGTTGYWFGVYTDSTKGNQPTKFNWTNSSKVVVKQTPIKHIPTHIHTNTDPSS